MAQTFTVPTTDDYTSSKTGRIHRYHQGDVISTALAVEFGMAGAALPEAGTPFSSEETVYLGENYPGATITSPQEGDQMVYDAASGTWINAPPSTDDDLNHLYNGHFESSLIGIRGWLSSAGVGGGTLTRETADPISGTGSLKQHIGTDTGGAGVNQSVTIRSTLGHIGETRRLTFKHRGEDIALMVYLDYTGASDVESDVYFTATAEVGEYEWDTVIPVGATAVSIQIGTDWNGEAQSDKDYWLDDIKWLTIALAP